MCASCKQWTVPQEPMFTCIEIGVREHPPGNKCMELAGLAQAYSLYPGAVPSTVSRFRQPRYQSSMSHSWLSNRSRVRLRAPPIRLPRPMLAFPSIDAQISSLIKQSGRKVKDLKFSHHHAFSWTWCLHISVVWLLLIMIANIAQD